MAVLSNGARAGVSQRYASDISAIHEGIGGLSKAELRAAINGIDDWVDANAAAFNTAIPQPARGALTASQKARLLTIVVERRHADGA